MIINKVVIGNWARALKNIAVEDNKMDLFSEQAAYIVEIIRENPNIVPLLCIHEGKDHKRIKIIDNIFSAHFDKNIVNALKIIVESDLFFYTKQIFKELIKLLSNHKNTSIGYAWTVTPLSEKNLKLLEEKFSNKYNKKIVLINKIDKSLIGGIQVIIEGENYTNAVKDKLLNIKEKILK